MILAPLVFEACGPGAGLPAWARLRMAVPFEAIVVVLARVHGHRARGRPARSPERSRALDVAPGSTVAAAPVEPGDQLLGPDRGTAGAA